MSTNTEKNICDTLAPVAVTIAAVAAKEIEQLKQTLQEKDTLLMAMEATCLTESERQAELEDSVIAWQDKYDRLYESHKRVQKVNQSLEDKLLKLVDRNTGERAQLTSDVATLSVRLAQANFNISKLQRDIERYKTDINLAIQLLQCKPDGFVPQKISSLPIDIQSKVSSYIRLDTNSHSDSEGSVTGVGISTTAAYKVLPATDSPPPAPCPFPPTAMVYSMRGLDAKQNSESNLNLTNNNSNNNNNNSTSDTLNNNNNNINSGNNTIRNSSTSLNTTNNNTNCHLNGNDMISPIVMAKFLEDELKAGEIKHCDTCQCSKDLTVLADVSRSYSVATQTPFTLNSSTGNLNDSMAQLCLRCYSNLNSPSRTNSPFTKNLLKSSDSVISETKSSVSDLNDMDKLFTPAKKDDLMVNPILGHHRLCERTSLLKGVSGQTNANKTSYNTILDNIKSLNGYQRRFIDGGGTALELLEERSKLLNSKREALKLVNQEDINGNEDLEDEEKPLLGPNIINSNLIDSEREERDLELKHKTKLRTESSCELGSAVRDQIKSPTASTKSALDRKLGNSLMKSQISGSVNSVWSKTSSCEGAKMFENFNRNLIKTIKAENPKYRGPRLCAMRIQQNGQSNILLDNIESIEAITPVIYRRRERLLDEELDDGKDIITSKTTMESQQTIETAKEAIETELSPKQELKTLDVANIQEDPPLEDDIKPSDKVGEDTILVCGDEKTDTLLEIKLEATNNKVCLPNTQPTTTNYDNTSKISGTQSSSISENIDFQETVILRRQQLSRVAEWVQNNTQQMEMEQQQQQQQQHLNALNHCDSSGTDHQSSFSTLDQLDSVSVEKLSMDSGYKTTPQLQPITNSSQDETIKTSDDSLSPKSDLNQQSPLNFAQNPYTAESPKQQQELNDNSTHNYSTPQTYYRRTSRSGLPVAYTSNHTDAQDSSSQCSQIIPEQPTCDILNYKYYPNDSDKTRAIKAELHTTTQNVDIAQMEYNVKQFLLKQNEWSMRTTRPTYNHTNTTNSNQSTATTTNRQTSIRHIKLFSNSTAGIGPGKGERVRTTISNTGGGGVAGGSCAKFNDLKVSSTTTNNNVSSTTTTTANNCSIPQRTETNL